MSELVTFTQTSDVPYDRHDYIVYFTDGNYRLFNNWEDANAFWFQFMGMGIMSHVEVLNKPRKKSKGKGF